MKSSVKLFVLITICLYGTGCTLEKCSCSQVKLAGNNIESLEKVWEFYSDSPGTVMEDVWDIEDGVLKCKGTPLGYLYTKKDYGDFVLKLEWLWPAGKKPGKGGILIRTTGENKIWPQSLEAQINTGDAGDFWGLAGYELSGPSDRLSSVNHDKFGKLTNVKKLKNLENPAGQWNSYEVIAEGDTVTLIINGEEVNRATGCAIQPGSICLTSEGDEIHFRNVILIPVNN